MRNRIMRPALDPKYIYAHRHEEQDVILWYNRALWHSIVSCPAVVFMSKLANEPADGVPQVLRPKSDAPVQYCGQ